MNGDTDEAARLNTNWTRTCDEAESFGEMSAQKYSEPFAGFIREEVRRFRDQAPPADKDEASARRSQRTLLTSKIQSIANAANEARRAPHRTEAIENETRRFHDNVLLTDDVITEANLFGARVNSICNR